MIIKMAGSGSPSTGRRTSACSPSAKKLTDPAGTRGFLMQDDENAAAA
jgi:hypothetical protein